MSTVVNGSSDKCRPSARGAEFLILESCFQKQQSACSFKRVFILQVIKILVGGKCEKEPNEIKLNIIFHCKGFVYEAISLISREMFKSSKERMATR